MRALALDIAGARVDLRLCGGAPRVLERFGPFARGRGPARWAIDVRPGAASGVGRLTGRTVARGGLLAVEGAERLGRLDPATRRGEAIADPGLVALEGLLRAALSLDVAARGGCLVHAAAVVVDGVAHLAPGRSGAGKTTLAALAGDRLADELAAVLPGARGFAVHGTPWWQGRPGSAPLAGVYALAWEDERVTPLSRAAALRHLAASLVLPVDGPAERAAAFAAAGRLAAAAPFARLAFRPGSDVDALLRRGAPARVA